MTPAEVCDLMDFWAAADWPLTKDEVQRLAVERFDWSIEVEDGTPYLMNHVSGFTIPDVSTIGARKHLHYLRLDTSDELKQVTPEFTAFLGDNFTLMVREGEGRWGKPTMRNFEGTDSAEWDRPSGGRIVFNLSSHVLSAMFQTPQGVELDRKLGY
ncbi:DUF6301 family protein [Arthrobacter sp. YN]|uniref:DUF6301 family protein n=1 Tax=Arthrobacter sp. YN TaxID=2020486 RepID=UPI000B619CB4|nr:DUF6301 family protein [Arthrobacter sp. YN]ASN21629.1 hypothetical protein CGK93_19610 [Arthrobacter sp. YN]